MPQQLCFFLIICDDDGVWSETFASLNFAFALHFWQRHHFHHLVRLAELTKTGPNFYRDLPRIRISVISPTILWAHSPEIFTKGFDISQTVNNNENLLNQNYVILNPRPCAAKNNICALVLLRKSTTSTLWIPQFPSERGSAKDEGNRSPPPLSFSWSSHK